MASKGRVKGRSQEQEHIALEESIDRDQDLEPLETFKPIFDEYSEEGGIPLRVLRQKLQEQGAADLLPPGKLELLIRKADADADGHLDYEEFVRLVTDPSSGLDRLHLTKFQQLVRGAVSSVVPNHATGSSGEEVLDGYIEYYNCKPPPLFIIIVSVVEVIVFIVYAVELSKAGTPVTATTGVPLYSPLVYNPYRRYEAWRYASYMMIHIGYTHLIFNLIFQLVIGLPLEIVHKWWRVGIVYILGVIAGSLATSVTDPMTFLAGASGGCYALIGAHFAIIIMNWKEMTHDWMEGPIRFILSAPVRLVFWTLFAGVDIGIAIWNRYHAEPGAQKIGYAAHLGGALAGVLIGIPVLKNINVLPWEKVLFWVCLAIYIAALIFMVCWNAFWPNFPETDWRPCCPGPP